MVFYFNSKYNINLIFLRLYFIFIVVRSFVLYYRRERFFSEADDSVEKNGIFHVGPFWMTLHQLSIKLLLMCILFDSTCVIKK